MSCFMVDRDLIDLLVTDIVGAGPWCGQRGALRDPSANPARWFGPDDADRVGRLLWGENLASVEYRYPDTAESGRDYPGPVGLDHETVATYTFQPVIGLVPNTWIINAVECYQYQACEHPGWSSSTARELTDAVLSSAAVRIAERDGAPYTFTRQALRERSAF